MQPLTLPVKLQPSWLTCRNQSVLKPASVMTVTALSFGMASWRRSRKRHCTSLFCASSAGTTSLIRGSERPLQSRLARRRCQFLSCQPVQSTAITQKGITEVMACVVVLNTGNITLESGIARARSTRLILFLTCALPGGSSSWSGSVWRRG